MTRDEFKQWLKSSVTRSTGIKHMDLFYSAVLHIAGLDGEAYEIFLRAYPEILQELVEAHDVIELEYILPQSNHKISSFFLPAGSIYPVGVKSGVNYV